MTSAHPTTEPIRVLIVDDHEMVRSGLAAFLRVSHDLELVGKAASGEAAISLSQALHPDVVLMDTVMPGMDGAAATRAIREGCPHTRVIALTTFPEEDLVQRALHAGAVSYLMKNIGAAELTAAIRAARHDRSTLAPESAQALIRQATRPAPPGHDLSARERGSTALAAGSGATDRPRYRRQARRPGRSTAGWL